VPEEFGAVAALLIVATADAHHSAAMFDDAKVLELKGTVNRSLAIDQPCESRLHMPTNRR
jgi:hypothetical protein